MSFFAKVGCETLFETTAEAGLWSVLSRVMPKYSAKQRLKAATSEASEFAGPTARRTPRPAIFGSFFQRRTQASSFHFRIVAMLAALVQVMAVPAPLSQAIDQGDVPGLPDFSDNNWAHNWHELITYSNGPVLTCPSNLEPH